MRVSLGVLRAISFYNFARAKFLLFWGDYVIKLEETFMNFLLEHQMKNSRTLNFIILMEQILNAAKSIQHYYNLSAISDNIGEVGEINVQGEKVMKLDRISHDLVLHGLRESKQVMEVTSEEEEEAIRLNKDGRYFLYIDPLDGSSNIKHSLPVGFLFGIAKRNLDGEEDYSLRAGNEFIASGMFMIPSGIFTFALRDGGCWRFLLSESGQYVRPRRVVMPESPKSWELSYNVANLSSYPDEVQGWLNAKTSDFAFRYAGSLAVDFHRLLNNGGMFLYPPIVQHKDPKKNRPDGKLRLMYECAVVALLAREAGGFAVDHKGNPVLDVVPQNRHQRSGIYVGSTSVVKDIQATILKANS